MRRKATYLFALLLAFCMLRARGERSQLFTAGRQGLSSTYVNQLLQDGHGFIWIATRGGLDRYDGSRFASWHKGELPSDHVTCLTEDADGRLVAGTTRGAVIYNYAERDFSPIALLTGSDSAVVHVTSLLPLGDGDLLVTAAGFGLFRLPRGTATARHTGLIFDGSSDLHSSALGPDGTVWVAGRSGVFSIGRDGKERPYLRGEGAGDCCVIATGLGQILAGTTGRGLFTYDALVDSFVPYPSGEHLNIVSMCELSDGSLLMGTNGNGSHLLRRGAARIEPCSFFNPQVELHEANVHCLMQDRDGTVWMGLNQKGLLMQPQRRNSAFKSFGASQPGDDIIGQHCVQSLCADGDGTLWVGTDGDGLYHVDVSRGRQIRHYAAGEGGMPATIMALTLDRTGRLWVGSWQQGGGWIDRASGKFHRLSSIERYGSANVMGLAVDSKNRLWASMGGGGLVCHNMATGEERHFGVVADIKESDNSISNQWPSQLLFAENERLLYICMSMGVACYDTERESFTSQFGRNHVLGSTAVNVACTDGQGGLWVGSDDGLLHLDGQGHTLRHYTTADGLPHNNVASLQIDPAGQLWIGTMKGLACKTGDTFACYYAGDGLQEGEWSDRAACSIGGLMAMGGVGGLSIIDPSACEQANSMVPHIELVDATMEGTPVALGQEFEMRHNTGSLSLHFATMIYDRPDAVSYKYSINGAEYTPLPSREGVLTLNNLAAGSYTIDVKAVVGNTESEPAKLKLTVRPPLYRSWQAMLLYLALSALGVWRLVVARRNRRRQQQALQQHIQAEQMKESKLQFFMSLNHEIRTPMTLIAAPLQQLIDSDRDEPRQRLYHIMQGATQRILAIINQILDLRKIDRGLLQMQMRPTPIAALIGDVCALFESKAAEHRIALHLDDRTEGCEVWVDPAHFDKVIMNLMSNAFKFTPDGGNVGVTIKRSETECTVAVWDDGQSIAAENLDRVFERFFQEDNSVNRATAGTGIGLNLARQLVQLHHGTIEAQALPDGQEGCAFVIRLPLGDSHLSESEKAAEEKHEEAAAQEPAPATEEKEKSKKPVIIVAEDEEEIRNYLAEELEASYNVVACADGRQALAEALRRLPALVLSDVMMPVMDGYTLCARLKSNSATNFVPVILLTAKTHESDKLEGLGHGADAYIEKPFNIDIVRYTIRNLIAAHDLLRNKLAGNEVPIDRIDEVRVATPDEQLLDRVVRVVNAHIEDPYLSVEQIAQEVGISRAHLHRKMKELTNLGPRDWVRNLRLQRAAQMLSQGHHNVSKVMHACGFDNQSSFSTKFKAQFGVSPSDYMKQHAPQNSQKKE